MKLVEVSLYNIIGIGAWSILQVLTNNQAVATWELEMK